MNEATAPTPEPPRTANFRRPGFNNIAPYFLVQGAPRFLDFLVFAFEATERLRVPRPDGSIMHAEVAIGPSDVIELGDANAQYPARLMTTHLYVADAHAAYARALEAGATAIHPPNDDHPSGDRWGIVTDPSATPGTLPRREVGYLALKVSAGSNRICMFATPTK